MNLVGLARLKGRGSGVCGLRFERVPQIYRGTARERVPRSIHHDIRERPEALIHEVLLGQQEDLVLSGATRAR